MPSGTDPATLLATRSYNDLTTTTNQTSIMQRPLPLLIRQDWFRLLLAELTLIPAQSSLIALFGYKRNRWWWTKYY